MLRAAALAGWLTILVCSVVHVWFGQSIDKKIFGQLYCVFESPAAAVEVAILAHRCVASDWRMDFDLATGMVAFFTCLVCAAAV